MATFIIVLLALAFTPSLISIEGNAMYANTDTEYRTKTSGTSKTISLLGNIRNDTIGSPGDHITVVLNYSTTPVTITETSSPISYLITSVGSYSGNSSITISGFVSADTNTIKIVYYYKIDMGSATITDLVPMLWVILILSIAAVAVYVQVKRIRQTRA